MRTTLHLIFRSAILALLFALTTTCEPSATNAAGSVVAYEYEVVATYPHDTQAFTQGFVYTRNGDRDAYYESTGLRGRSSLRLVDLKSGRVLRSRQLDARYFGEGLALHDGRLIQLTWQLKTGFIYDAATFEKLSEFRYTTEGWGLTYDADRERLILSDGSDRLYFYDPKTLRPTDWVAVRDEGRPVERLNELEYIDGKVYANVWQTDRIVIIDPADGNVTGRVDLHGLLDAKDLVNGPDVLNGIAHDAKTGRLFVTGKLWPKVFEIRLRKK